MISQKKILLSLVTMVFGTTLAMSNMVYAGNPAESHDPTSPPRRVEDMNYTNLSYNMAAQTCNECQKQVEVDQVKVDQVKHKAGHHYRKHHGHHGAAKTYHHVKHSTQK